MLSAMTESGPSSRRPRAPSQWSDALVRSFYGGPGARMHDPALQTPEIAHYLAAEEQAVDRACESDQRLNHILEIGAGQGRYLPWAHARGLHYDGLDIIASEVAPPPHDRLRSVLHHGAAERVDALFRDQGLDDPRYTTMLLLPFNCLGNVARLDEAIAAMARVRATIFVSLFRDDPLSTRARLTYYAACGYSALEAVDVAGVGVRVTSREGLRSYAYTPERLRELFAPHGLHAQPTVALGTVGLGLILTP